MEEYARQGVSLFDALEHTADLRVGGSRERNEGNAGLPADEGAVARMNEQGMAELQKMLGGVSL